MLNNTTILRKVREYIEENTREMYADDKIMLEESLENTNYEFMMTDEDELIDRYIDIINDELDIYRCEECGDFEESGDMEEVYNVDEGYTMYVCNHCVSCNCDIFLCEEHNRMEIDENSYYVEDYGRICSEALEYGDFGCCDNCGCLYHIDNLYTTNDGYYLYCEECYEDMGCDIIGGYHEADFEFQTLNNEPKIGIGFELETEFDGNYIDIAREINSLTLSYNLHLEEDCSLHNGFEIVSNPMSMDYFSTKFDNTIDEIVNICKHNYNYDHNSAGFHVHTTKRSNLQTANLIYLVEYFREELTKLAKREGRSLDRWASFYTNHDKAEFNGEMFNVFYEMVIDDDESRYHALNITNRYTNEFRIFKGSIDALEIKARCELCHNMASYAQYLAENYMNVWEQDLDFMEIITFSYDNYTTKYIHRDFIEAVQLTMEI
jgi:hypothetical protein